MPLVRKRGREEELKQDTAKRQRKCKEFTEFENIGYTTDHWHTVFRSIPEQIVDLKNVLRRHIGSFINGDGGILCFGARKTGVIYGEEVSRREEDNIRLLIDEIFKKMHPHVPTDGYRVTFTPVLGSAYRRRDGVKEVTKLQVLEVRVARGDPFSLYEDCNHEVFLRKGDSPYGPLTPHEIKRHTVQQLRNQLKSQKTLAKLFDTPKLSRRQEKDKENKTAKRKKSSSVSSIEKPSSRPSSRQSSRHSSLSSVSDMEKSDAKKSTKISKRTPTKPLSSAKEVKITDKTNTSFTKKSTITKSTEFSPERSSYRLRSRQSSAPSSPNREKSAAKGKEKSTSGKSERPPPSRHNSQKNLPVSNPPKTAPGSCKECPFVLSSGESDHEVPLPPLPCQKQSEQEKVIPSAKKGISTKQTIQPFQLKKASGPSISPVNPLEIELGKMAESAQGQGTSSIKPPSVVKQPLHNVVKPTVKLPPLNESVPTKNSISSRPTTTKASQLPLNKPTTAAVSYKTAAVKQVEKSSRSAIIPPLIPPPPPPQPLLSMLPRPYAQVPPSYSRFSQPPEHRYGYSRPQQYPKHHSRYGYHSNYSHNNYYGYSTGARASAAPSYSAHPLATSYSAPYCGYPVSYYQ